MLTPLAALWMPILLSAVLVFVASAIMWMAMPHHKTDFRQIPDEDKVLDAMRAAGLERGAYFFPYCQDRSKMNDPAVKEKFNKGPVGTMVVMRSGNPAMAGNMAVSFVYNVILSVFVAYVAGVTLAPGAEYLRVFQVAGTAAILANAGAHAPRSIWFQVPWSNTIKDMFDGVVYGLLTAGAFGWLWPA